MYEDTGLFSESQTSRILPLAPSSKVPCAWTPWETLLTELSACLAVTTQAAIRYGSHWGEGEEWGGGIVGRGKGGGGVRGKSAEGGRGGAIRDIVQGSRRSLKSLKWTCQFLWP